uniref:Zinc finger, C2H2 type n=1 Tax=Angiostrongylus cantonensis TaxID=6313 RepID=A0A0K0DCJ5_ANGCA
MLQDRVAWETHVAEVHCSSKRYRCDTCNAQFSSKDSLVSHMRYHPGLRAYRCTICTKSFCRSTSLALHMKMHITGHRHFCQICGRWFKSLSSLNEHEVGWMTFLDYFLS